MLADPRAEALVSNFAGQWLYLRNLQTSAQLPHIPRLRRQPAPGVPHRNRTLLRQHPARRPQRPRPARTPTTPSSTSASRSTTESPTSTAASSAASRYVRRIGSTPCAAACSVKVLSSRSRRNPTAPSPVDRGKTVMQIFLGVSPPDPPPNVLDHSPRPVSTVHGGAKPFMRQQIEMHRKNDPCVTCHKIMDPIGFALENFDAIGHGAARTTATLSTLPASWSTVPNSTA